jgi:aspartate aminotransferase
MCERLLTDTGVAILPGADFERPLNELSARLAYVNFDGSQALAASREIPLDQELTEEFLTRHAAETIEAMERLAAWVSEGMG